MDKVEMTFQVIWVSNETFEEGIPISASEVLIIEAAVSAYWQISAEMIEILHRSGSLPSEEPPDEDLYVMDDGRLLVHAKGMPLGVLFPTEAWSSVAKA